MTILEYKDFTLELEEVDVSTILRKASASAKESHPDEHYLEQAAELGILIAEVISLTGMYNILVREHNRNYKESMARKL